ncbi:MAG: hypothetical protein R3C49_15320 [Planctomycetaceae bacterium]
MTEPTENPNSDDYVPQPDPEADASEGKVVHSNDGLSAEELRAARINAIRDAIQEGAYDTDELLLKALKRMVDSSEDHG